MLNSNDNIFDIGKEGEIHYIVFEFVSGITIEEAINQNISIPISEKFKIIIQIALDEPENYSFI